MVTVALAGNPNCGKTSLFNALTGARHHVGNWAGVTVERRSGSAVVETAGQASLELEIVDLPGTYSLSAKTEDERIAATYLSEPEVDVIVNVLDASNLERNLFLTTQLLELKKPMVFALNMVDDARRQGVVFDLKAMSLLLGGPVVGTVGNRGEGITELKAAIAQASGGAESDQWPVRVTYGTDIEEEIGKIAAEIQRDEKLAARVRSRLLAIRLLDGATDALVMMEASHARKAIQAQLKASSEYLEDHLGADPETLLTEHRYGFAKGLVHEVIDRSQSAPTVPSNRLDRVLTHRFLGIPVFIAIMVAMYALTFIVGAIPQEWIGQGFEWLQGFASTHLPPGELASLLADGIIPGVGSVVVFLPVIMILMGCISFLEDSGYMARAAFIMDRLMHLMGLHGKSFIPLIMGMGCNAPAIQATRTIESRSDRLITILVNPLISCSARLPVYILFAGAFFSPFHGALVVVGMHVLGFVLAIVMGKLLRLSLFRREHAPFVMELPPYRMPIFRTTLMHMWEKGSVFLKKAGTVIFAGATLVWFLSHYPGLGDRQLAADHQRLSAEIKAKGLPEADETTALQDLDFAHQGRIMNTSFAARIGTLVQPIFRPIFDPDHARTDAWKDGVALTAGFVAKEIVVGTLAIVHQAKEEGSDGPVTPLQESIRRNSGLTPLTALAFMIFTLIYTPCLGTVAMIKKETMSWKWTGFSIGYGLVLGWLLAWIVVVAGRALGFN
jgi:ferrous iron transport protein B